MKHPKIISLSGNIAVGKTTLLKTLKKKLPCCQTVEENPNCNPYIKDFYQDMKQWCFISRIPFLVEKIVGNLSVIPETEFLLFDRSYDELLIFARHQFQLGNLNLREYETYVSLFNAVKGLLPPVDCVVYMYCSTLTSLQRLKKRGNHYEKNIDINYLNHLDIQYSEWLSTIKDKKIIEVNTDLPYDINRLALQIIELNS